jgi:3-deoxy-D-manno-octulosonic-acid transferase
MPLLPWLLNCVYLLLLVLASPILAWRAVRHGKYRDGAAQKLLGCLPASAADERVIWFHAVSVGEVLQLETIIPPLAKQHPDATILITSTTNTGLDVARQKFPDYRSCYFPLDFSWAVRNALRRVRPALVVLVELELWPNFILHAAKTSRLAIINGRLSERSYRGYRRIRRLVEPVLRSFTTIGVQTATYADRMCLLGARAETVHVTGSIKFDRVQTDRFNSATQSLRKLFQLEPDALVLVAGSTQAPEEVLAVQAWKQLRQDFPTLRLVVVPRHKERFDEVARLIAWQKVTIARRSQLGDLSSAEQGIADDAVILLDTLGELSDCWGLADVAFVGGSFGDRGGQNMIEPAAFGAAVLVGPNTVNFRDVMSQLEARDAITVVSHTERLVAKVRELLLDPIKREKMGRAARKTVLEGTGASQKTLKLIGGVWGSVSQESGRLRKAA